MKKFGFRREKSSGASDNPYAEQSADDQYTAPSAPPYQQARVGLPSGPRAGRAGPSGGPGPQSGYGAPSGPPSATSSFTGYASAGSAGRYDDNPYAQNSQSYGANQQRTNSFGAQSTASVGAPPSYRSQRTDSGYTAVNQPSFSEPPSVSAPPSVRAPPSARGPGGYGGFDDPDAARKDLFAARSQPPPYKPTYGSVPDDNAQSGLSSDSQNGYGDRREMTEEELEEESVSDAKRQIHAELDESSATLDRILAIGNQGLGYMNNTFGHLAAQREMLNNTEKNLDRANVQNRIASDKTRELEHYNRSMFSVSTYGSKKHQAERLQRQFEQENLEREIQSKQRGEAYRSNQRLQGEIRDMATSSQLGLGSGKANKWELSDDEEEPETFEDDDGSQAAKWKSQAGQLAAAKKMVAAMKDGAVKMGEEIGAQSRQIDTLTEKSAVAEQGTRRVTNKLGGIK